MGHRLRGDMYQGQIRRVRTAGQRVLRHATEPHMGEVHRRFATPFIVVPQWERGYVPGPGGHWQWRVKGAAADEAKLMRPAMAKVRGPGHIEVGRSCKFANC